MSDRPTPPSSRPLDGRDPQRDPDFPEQPFPRPSPTSAQYGYPGIAIQEGTKSHKGLITLLVLALLLAFGMIFFVRSGPKRSSAPPSPIASAPTQVVSAVQAIPLNCGSFKDADCSKVDYTRFASWVERSKAEKSGDGMHLDCVVKGTMSFNKLDGFIVSVNACNCVCEKK